MTTNTTRTITNFESTLIQLTAPVANNSKPTTGRSLPSWAVTASLLEDLRDVLLMNPDPAETRLKLDRAIHSLDTQVKACLSARDIPGTPLFSKGEFLSRLPQIKKDLEQDTGTALACDPAARSRAEIALCYPGLRTLTYYRIAHALARLDIPLLPRLITEIAHSATGIDIHPDAKIGKRFFIDHGTGVVIGATCVIGDDVKVYQGVTLGARSFPKSGEGRVIKGLDRHPVIGDRVTIYAGATILGRVHIGSDSVIGGNVWITKDVPEKSNVMQRRPRHDKFIHGDGI